MKILMGISSETVTKRAVKVLKALEDQSLRNPYSHVPVGIPAHAVRYPVVCDDCGETFWANDPYAVHKDCTSGRKAVGFSERELNAMERE